jgi:hypothetical protein
MARADANRINYTEFELAMGPQLAREIDDYDFFIVPTRDPYARSVSAFNYDHLIGGNPSGGASALADDWQVKDLPPSCSMGGCTFCVAGESLDSDPAYSFNHREGIGALAPYLVPNMTEAPLVTPCDYDTYAGFMPTAAKPLMAHMYMDCFAQLPGGVNAWAESLDGHSPCANLASRHLHETAESVHMNNGYDEFYRKSGLQDKLRAEAVSKPKNGRLRALIVVRCACVGAVPLKQGSAFADAVGVARC